MPKTPSDPKEKEKQKIVTDLECKLNVTTKALEE
jgi:hypothetical protein